MKPSKNLFKITFILVTLALSGCVSYPRVLRFPYDTGGRGLNSPTSELTPQINRNYIVFVSDRNGSQDIYLFDTSQRTLIDLPGLNSLDTSASHPSISEDGRYIVFMASRLGIEDVYLYDRETNIRQNLTENLQAEIRNPMISADGSKITFEANKDGQWDIFVYDRSGKPLIN